MMNHTFTQKKKEVGKKENKKEWSQKERKKKKTERKRKRRDGKKQNKQTKNKNGQRQRARKTNNFDLDTVRGGGRGVTLGGWGWGRERWGGAGGGGGGGRGSAFERVAEFMLTSQTNFKVSTTARIMRLKPGCRDTDFFFFRFSLKHKAFTVTGKKIIQQCKAMYFFRSYLSQRWQFCYLKQYCPNYYVRLLTIWVSTVTNRVNRLVDQAPEYLLEIVDVIKDVA